jgi:DNA adenine methylase
MVQVLLTKGKSQMMHGRTKRITSPLRYPGGKHRVLQKILPLVPVDFAEYREPFLGGGSLFISLKQLFPKARYKLGDFNRDLCSFWMTLRDNPKELIGGVTRIKKTYRDGKRLYRKLIRADESLDALEQAIRFFVLNRITYSGTIDSGGYSAEAFEKRFTSSSIAKLEPLSGLLQNVEIVNESYEKLLFDSGDNVLIYLDPPYWKSRKSKLYGKNGDLHTFFDHRKFAEDVRRCEHRWLMTCDDSSLMRGLFGFANIICWKTLYGMTNVNGKRASVGKELLVANYSIPPGPQPKPDLLAYTT